MKVEVIKNEDQEITYPCLMEAKDRGGLIVFMRREKSGVVLVGDRYHSLGACSDDWVMDALKPFTGKLVLSNE